jgi:hypothetical protein
MVNREIFEGLDLALERKQPLEKAMMSFYNAGYNKREIEEAAKALILERSKRKKQMPAQVTQPAPVKKEEKPEPISLLPVGSIKQTKTPKKEKIKVPKIPIEVKKTPKKPVQKVKKQKKPRVKKPKPVKAPKPPKTPKIAMPKQGRVKPKTKVVQKVSAYDMIKKSYRAIIAILVIILFFLLGILLTLFITKEGFMDLFRNLFG